ncbi:hypothetical protein KC19_6G026800 [Ceratodon purpureus]|uniref:Uncharacterized protein n=1 Tax=Ceratodon purpureus TaxID=3225 RepID=A0A8T0HDN6_CERPU|nr:hypothetical protein KC19_N039600 [Ceratodon purpureus]KAG0568538.1 hypothetical protein KC19_6G026800 [Ceratodon purpureus]
MEVAMAGPRMESLGSLGSLGSFPGFGRTGAVRFGDRGHERFYGVGVRCGKKEKRFAGRIAKVRELVDVQRSLVLLSRRVDSGQVVGGSVGGFVPEDAVQIGVSDPDVSQLILDRIMRNLEDLQEEVESLNAKAMKKKKKDGSSSSSSSSSESSDSADMGEALDMRALRKRKISGKYTRAALPAAAQTSESNSIPTVHIETFLQTHAVAEAATLPSFLSAEGNSTGMASAVSGSDNPQEGEPAIVAQIRALCSTPNSPTSATTREIYRRGPIELKDTPSGRVIVDATSPSPDSIPVSTDVSTSGKIEVCTVGKCKRGGSHEILASLQEYIPESSDIQVTSCKCMGKCKSAPNVRVKTSEGQTRVHSHVSVDDVETLLELHFGEQSSASQSSAMPMLFARVDSGIAAA